MIEGMNEAGTTADQLQQRIQQSVNRSRASYLDTADAISKMGIMAEMPSEVPMNWCSSLS